MLTATTITLNADLTYDASDPSYTLQAFNPPDLSLRNAVTLAGVYASQGDNVKIELNQNASYVFSTFASHQFGGGIGFTQTPTITQGNIEIDGNGSTLSLSGATNQEFLAISGTASVVLNDLTISGGTSASLGGAMSIEGQASLTANSVTFNDNSAVGAGQGAYLGSNDGGYAGRDGAGGAVYDDSSGLVQFTNSTFTGNIAQGGEGTSGGNYGARGGNGYGGAVMIDQNTGGTVNFNNTTFSNNLAQGGLTDNNGDGLSFNQDANYAQSAGGAVYIGGGATVTFTDSMLNGNKASGRAGDASFDDHNGEDGGLAQGGAIFVFSSTLNVVGGFISGNTAAGGTGGDNYSSGDQAGKGGNAQGGGIYAQSAQVNVSQGALITQNSAQAGVTGATSAGVHLNNAEPNSPVIYTDGPLDYGISQGGGIYISANGSSLNINNATLSNNTVQGRRGEDEYFQSNGEDGGTAQGGGVYAAVGTGQITISNNSTFQGNSAIGGVGGAGGSGSYDLSGKGGDAEGGALYLSSGTLSMSDTALTENTVTAGQNGTGNYGVVAVAPVVPNQGPPTPQRDPSRISIAAGGAVYAAGGAVTIANPTIRGNSAAGSKAPDREGGSQGRAGGDALGGALYFNSSVGSVQLTNGTFTKNYVQGGAGGTSDNDGGLGGSGGDGQGGAIFSNAAMTVDGTTFSTNLAYGGLGGTSFNGASGTNGGGYGGAIYASAGLTTSQAAFFSNAVYGGPQTGNFAGAGRRQPRRRRARRRRRPCGRWRRFYHRRRA